MNEEAQPEAQEITAESELPQLGQLLIAARERWNLSAADLARQLRLALRQVQALEENRFEALPGNTFVRGFIRNYARVVQTEPEVFLAAYERGRPQLRQPEIEISAGQMAFPSKTTPKWVWYSAAMLVVLVVSPLLIYLALHDDETPAQQLAKSTNLTAEPEQQAASDVPLSIPAPSAVLQNTMPSIASAAVTAIPIAQNPQVTPAPTRASEPAPETSTANGASTVQLQFDGDAWVEIRDKSRKIVFSQLSRQGNSQVVQGKPPFSLVVGNANQVKIAYNGKPFDLTPHTRVNVARFKLE